MNAGGSTGDPKSSCRFLSPGQCAEIVGLSKFTIYAALASGALRGNKPTGPRGKWLVLEEDLFAWASTPADESRTHAARREIDDGARRHGGTSVAEMLRERQGRG